MVQVTLTGYDGDVEALQYASELVSNLCRPHQALVVEQVVMTPRFRLPVLEHRKQ